MLVDQDPFQAAFPPDFRDGGEPVEAGGAGLNWPVPDFSTLCRRQKTLAVQVPYRRADGPLNMLVDSTGIKFLGDGEWQIRKHGVQGRRQWRKVHSAMDPAASDIRAVEFTPSRDGDNPVLLDLLGQVPEDEQIGTVTANGAYDTRRCQTAIFARKAIPIRKNGRLWKDDSPAARARSETLRATRYYGRAFWKRWTGYHARSRIEAKMRCLKSFGERIMARDPDARPPKSTSATPSAPQKSFVSPDVGGVRGSHASGLSSATMPVPRSRYQLKLTQVTFRPQ